MPGDTMFAANTTYGPVAMCIPMGIGIKKLLMEMVGLN